jgi:hypothetical protein
MGCETEAELRYEAGLRSRALSVKRPCTGELLRVYILGTLVNRSL